MNRHFFRSIFRYSDRFRTFPTTSYIINKLLCAHQHPLTSSFLRILLLSWFIAFKSALWRFFQSFMFFLILGKHKRKR